MRTQHRLRKLEARRNQLLVTLNPELSDPEWFEVFARAGRKGELRHEPDFPKALALYERAIAAAERIAPEIDPPRSFMIRHPRRLPKLYTWRTDPRFEAVRDAFVWLCELYARGGDGVPPVSESEFAELAAWFRENEPRLRQQYTPSGLLPDAKGKTTLTNVRVGLDAGPRVLDAGRIAETVRRLRANSCASQEVRS